MRRDHTYQPRMRQLKKHLAMKTITSFLVISSQVDGFAASLSLWCFMNIVCYKCLNATAFNVCTKMRQTIVCRTCGVNEHNKGNPLAWPQYKLHLCRYIHLSTFLTYRSEVSPLFWLFGDCLDMPCQKNGCSVLWSIRAWLPSSGQCCEVQQVGELNRVVEYHH